jgi:hypothetical protein
MHRALESSEWIIQRSCAARSRHAAALVSLKQRPSALDLPPTFLARRAGSCISNIPAIDALLFAFCL